MGIAGSNPIDSTLKMPVMRKAITSEMRAWAIGTVRVSGMCSIHEGRLMRRATRPPHGTALKVQGKCRGFARGSDNILRGRVAGITTPA